MRGGHRENAGRKRGFSAIKAEEARSYFAERVANELEPIVNSLLEKAKKGDIQAIRELCDRAWGRPPQSTTIEGLPTPVLLVDV